MEGSTASNAINEYKTALEESEQEETTDGETQQQDQHECHCNHNAPAPHPHHDHGPFSRPGPYQGPLIVGQRHPYPPAMGYGPGRPGIIDKMPPKCNENCNNCNKDDNKVSADELLESLSQIKILLNSYISEQNTMSRNDLNDCGCDLGVPVVNNVPHDAMDKDLYIIEDTENNTDNNP